MEKNLLMGEKEISALLERLAAEVRERESAGDDFYLVGIHTRGIPLAHRLAKFLRHGSEEIGTLDINLYRDDLSSSREMPILRETHIPFDVEGKSLLLVDDVLYTGRTIRAALDALTDLGRPKCIKLLTLLDRGERELPIQADFCGKILKVGPKENVKVRLKETDGYDGVEVLKVSDGRE